MKNINDIHGHDAGDLVLAKIAGMIKKISHGYDMISRIGGEEFFIVLPGVDSEHAETISEQVRKEIEETPVILSDETRKNRAHSTQTVTSQTLPSRHKESYFDKSLLCY